MVGAPIRAFVRSREGLAAPDLLLGWVPMLTEPGPKGPRIARQSGMTCYAHPMRPESRGHIHIVSADAKKPPAINFNFLSSPVDAELTVRAVRIACSIMHAPALAHMQITEIAPGPDRRSDDEILDWVKQAAETTYHPVGTCKMGSDAQAVVDARLRVHGIAGLRVADASIMPTLTSGNTNAPSIMIGEKAAAMVLEDAAMTEPGPASFTALRNAVLEGHEPPPLQAVARLSWYPWVVVGTVCVGAFMGQVDASLTQMLLPRLERDFHAPLSTVSWVAVAYILTMASFMPIFGRLADMIGRKLLYTGAFLLFVIGSGLCGFAPDLPTLIVFRIVQGIGAALMTANSIAIVVLAARPRASRPRARAAVGGAGDRAGRGAGGGRPGARHAGLALGVLDQRAVRAAGLDPRLVRAAADPASAERRPLRLAWRVADRAGADSHRRAVERGPCLGRDIARLHRLRRGRGGPSGAVRPGRAACRDAADRFRAAAPARLPDRQPRELPVLRHAVRRVLPHPLRVGPRLPGLRACRRPATFDRAGDAGPAGAGRRRPLRPLRRARGDRGRHGALRRGTCRALLFLDGKAANMPLVMLALAIFGAGQGLFISPNSSAIMATAPEELTGEAGSLLNVVRYLGISTGIAGASTLLALGIADAPGSNGITVDASAEALIFASRLVIVMLGVLGVLAGAFSLMRTVPRKARAGPAVE